MWNNFYFLFIISCGGCGFLAIFLCARAMRRTPATSRAAGAARAARDTHTLSLSLALALWVLGGTSDCASECVSSLTRQALSFFWCVCVCITEP